MWVKFWNVKISALQRYSPQDSASATLQISSAVGAGPLDREEAWANM